MSSKFRCPHSFIKSKHFLTFFSRSGSNSIVSSVSDDNLFYISSSTLHLIERYFSVYFFVIIIKQDQIQLIQPIFAMIICEMDVQPNNIACQIGNFYQRLLHCTIFTVIWFTKSSFKKFIAVWVSCIQQSLHLKFNKVRNQQRQANYRAPPMMVANHHRSFNYLAYHR